MSALQEALFSPHPFAWLAAATDLDLDPISEAVGLLPVCGLDCVDGAHFYRTLTAWLVPFQKVPRAAFYPVWFVVSSAARAELIARHNNAFADELGADTWIAAMARRDDAVMLRAALDAGVLLPASADTAAAVDDLAAAMNTGFVVEQLFQHGAAECVAELMRDVAPGDWDMAFALALTRTGMQMRPGEACRADEEAERLMEFVLAELLIDDACIEKWGRAGWACTIAAARGHLALLQLLRGERGRCQCSGGRSVFRAAVHGHANCLRYLVGSGCPWSPVDTLLGAAVGGDLECVRFVLMDDRLGLATSTAAKAYNAAAAGGHVPAMQLILEHFGAAAVDPYEALEYASSNGEADCVRFILHQHAHVFAPESPERRAWRTDELAANAIAGGHLDCAQLMGRLRPWRARTLCIAAAHRHIECMRYLLETGCPVEMPDALESALRGGSVDCVQLILDSAQARGGVSTRRSSRLPPTSECACCQAGSVECLRFVHQRGARVCGKCVKSALGDPDKLRYLLQTAGATTEDPQDYYRAAGHIESLRLLYDTAGLRWVEPRWVEPRGKKRGRRWTTTASDVCNMAVVENDGSGESLAYVFDVVKCPLSESAFEHSMYGMKSYECMQTAYERACPWSAKSTERAALLGNLGALRWLRERGCPWTAATCLAAARMGRVLCLRYAVERGCPWDPVKCSAAARAAQERNYLGAAECLVYITGAIATNRHSARIAAAEVHHENMEQR